MKVFGDYSRYYNLIYEDKDYVSEVSYIQNLIKKYANHARTILDLGCGTGKHDVLLAKKGFDVIGVDLSPEMLGEAARQKKLAREVGNEIEFHHGDIRKVRLKNAFDVVVSLFDVISYQITNSDLKNVFETISVHLQKGGICIFDCWYGPGVLSDPPTVRVKRFENERLVLTRIAEPTIHMDRNLVDVYYHLFVRDKQTRQVEEVSEKHTMRYLFKPEVEMIFEDAGFELIGFSEFMGDAMPEPGKWDVCFVGRKK